MPIERGSNKYYILVDILLQKSPTDGRTGFLYPPYSVYLISKLVRR